MYATDMFYLRLETIERELNYIREHKLNRELIFKDHKYVGYSRIDKDYPYGNYTTQKYVVLDRLMRYNEYDIIKVVVKQNIYHPKEKQFFAKLTSLGEELLGLIMPLHESFKIKQLRTLVNYLFLITEYNTEEWKAKNKLSPFFIRKKYGYLFDTLLSNALCVPKNNATDVLYAQYELTEYGKEWLMLIKKLLYALEKTQNKINELLEKAKIVEK